MPRLLDLADVLRSAGLTVVETPGWRTRGGDAITVQGIVWHHTATGPNWTDARVTELLVDGRSDLPGPLCQLGLDRAGRYHVIASGRANHNGYGQWGNQSIGIEAYNDGVGEPWPRAQLDAYDRGTAALCRAYGLTAARVKGHKETDPRRKVDPRGIDMNAARQRVAALITYQPPAKPTPPPKPKGPLMALTDKQQEELLEKVRDLHKEQPGIVLAIKATRAWVRVVAEMVGRAAGKTPAELADRADELNK